MDWTVMETNMRDRKEDWVGLGQKGVENKNRLDWDSGGGQDRPCAFHATSYYCPSFPPLPTLPPSVTLAFSTFTALTAACLAAF